MGFLDTLLGRTKPVPAQPGRAVLAAHRRDHAAGGDGPVPDRHRLGLLPRRRGQGVQRHREGRPRAAQHGRGTASVEVTKDSYGFTWLICQHAAGRLRGAGHRPARGELLAGGRRVRAAAAVHPGQLPRRHRRAGWASSTCTSGARSTRSRRSRGSSRDNALELQVRGPVGADLKIEPDLGRWFAVWGAPASRGACETCSKLATSGTLFTLAPRGLRGIATPDIFRCQVGRYECLTGGFRRPEAVSRAVAGGESRPRPGRTAAAPGAGQGRPGDGRAGPGRITALTITAESASQLSAPGGLATFAGSLTGMVGTYLALIMVLLVSRIPVDRAGGGPGRPGAAAPRARPVADQPAGRARPAAHRGLRRGGPGRLWHEVGTLLNGTRTC